MKRRDFLKTGFLGGGAAWAIAPAAIPSLLSQSKRSAKRRLVHSLVFSIHHGLRDVPISIGDPVNIVYLQQLDQFRFDHPALHDSRISDESLDTVAPLYWQRYPLRAKVGGLSSDGESACIDVYLDGDLPAGTRINLTFNHRDAFGLQMYCDELPALDFGTPITFELEDMVYGYDRTPFTTEELEQGPTGCCVTSIWGPDLEANPRPAIPDPTRPIIFWWRPMNAETVQIGTQKTSLISSWSSPPSLTTPRNSGQGDSGPMTLR